MTVVLIVVRKRNGKECFWFLCVVLFVKFVFAHARDYLVIMWERRPQQCARARRNTRLRKNITFLKLLPACARRGRICKSSFPQQFNTRLSRFAGRAIFFPAWGKKLRAGSGPADWNSVVRVRTSTTRSTSTGGPVDDTEASSLFIMIDFHQNFLYLGW